jgi:hypothetical protein
MSEISSKPNVDWWIDQINSGIYFRQDSAFEQHWPQWRKYYRNDFGKDQLPMNFYFSLLRSMVPRVYFKNPAVSITPGMPGLEAAAFAQIQERIDNKLFIHMKVKKQVKKMIHNAFLYGTAGSKIGYGAEFSPTPNIVGDTSAPFHRTFGAFEYKSGVMPNMPWFSSVHPKHLVVPHGCEDIDDARWVAVLIERPFLDVKKDPRFKNTTDLNPNRSVDIAHGNRSFKSSQPIDMVRLYEIHDKKYKQVLVLSLDHEKFLYRGSDDLLTTSGFPVFDLVFNYDDECFWGLPDSLIIEPQQLEMNEIRSQIMYHRRLTLIKLMHEANMIEPHDLAKLLSGEVMASVQVKDINAVKPFQLATIPPELITAGQLVQSDVREQVGFSRNQSGELSDSERTTATEASIVQMASEIRVDERQDLVAEMLHNMVKSIHNIIYTYWREEQIIDIVGPGGIPLWVEFSGKMLSGGSYEIGIEPESSLPMTKQARSAKALQGYQLFKDNPLVDPIALTRYTLREYYGFKYEDLMQGIPKGAGQTQPMQIGDYAKMLGNAGGQVPTPGQGGGG